MLFATICEDPPQHVPGYAYIGVIRGCTGVLKGLGFGGFPKLGVPFKGSYRGYIGKYEAHMGFSV